LQVEERLPADQIVVLTPLSRGKSKLWTGTTQSSLRLTEKWPAPAGQVCCSTIHAFKGLEASVVVLAEVECLASRQWTDADSLLYVACSRACSHLIVLLPDSVDARLREVFTGAGKR
jgi:superfamily I DNA/RNA helicase